MKNMKHKFSSKDWHKLLVPEFTVNAISIEDRVVRVFCFDKKIERIARWGKYALPKGIIEEGILKKPEYLKSFFNSLYKKLWPKEKTIWTILTLPSANFFIHIFNLPDLEEERFNEAIVFNTQMVAPLSLEESYFDWEDWGVANRNGEKEVFVALGVKKQIDPYLEILKESGFNVVAVEPLAVSLARFNNKFIEKEEPVLIIDLRPEGIEFVIAEGEKTIYFDFDSWEEIFGKDIPKQITFDILKKHISCEIPVLLNFYSLKRKKVLQKFVFFSFNNQLANVLKRWIQVQYQLVPGETKLPSHLKQISGDWFGVLGAALRGLIPRNKDTIVSLAPVGTEQSYEQHQLLRLVSLSSKAIIAVLIALVLSLGLISNFFFLDIENQYQLAIAKPLEQKTVDKEANLTEAANEFNKLVAQVSNIEKYQKDWKNVLEAIFDNANQSSVHIKRVFISSEPANNITIQGNSSIKESIISFKDSLGLTGLFADISLPLSGLVETTEGVTFNLSLAL